jgi:hypothetical protein
MQKRRVWDEEVWDFAYMRQNQEEDEFDDSGRPLKWCWCRDGDGGREGCQFVRCEGIQPEKVPEEMVPEEEEEIEEEEEEEEVVKDTVTVIEMNNLPAQSKLWRPWEDSPSCEAAAGEEVSCEAADDEGVCCEAPADSPKVEVNVKKVVFHEEVPNCEATVEGEVSCAVLSSLSDVPVTPPVLETPRKPWAGRGPARGGEESPGRGEGGRSLRRYWYWRPWAGGGASPRRGGETPRSGGGGRGLRRLLTFQGKLVREEGAPPTGLQWRQQPGEGREGGGRREGGPWGAATPVTPCKGGLSASTIQNISLHNPLAQGGWQGHSSPSGTYLCHTCHTWGELWPMVQ